MQTLNNQLILLGLRAGDRVMCDSWLGEVYLNEFGLGVSIVSSHDPSAICDGSFPPLPGLRPVAKAASQSIERTEPENDPDREQLYCGDPD